MEKIPTPLHCTADFCLLPIGTPTASVSKEIAAVQRLMQQSGLEYQMHSAGTTLRKLELLSFTAMMLFALAILVFLPQKLKHEQG
jgi:uncharacterized protein YqgV (UPF0045/DUF77 family)